MISRLGKYAKFLRELDEARRAGILARRIASSAQMKRKFEVNPIDTCILLNEAMSEIKLKAPANPRMALLDTASPLTDIRKGDGLLDVK